jgi:hypothetical protein
MAKRLPAVLAILLASAAFGAQGPSRSGEAPGAERQNEPESAVTPVLAIRIAADAKHDQGAVEKAKSQDGLRNPPTGYRWVRVDERALDLREEDIVREESGSGGTRRKYLLVKLGPNDVTEADLSRVEKARDERQHPAIAVYFKPEGARRLGELTRTHLPEDTGGPHPFRYKLAIIIDEVAGATNRSEDTRRSGAPSPVRRGGTEASHRAGSGGGRC